MKKIIKITCTTKDFLDVESIESLQGELKKISQASMDKLKNSIKTYGFSFPVFVWKSGKKNYSIDGVHRCKALKELETLDGYAIPKQVPVVFIQAKDQKQAKELLLAASSQYAAMNKNYLINEFITDLDLEHLQENIEIPQIDIDALIQQNIQNENDDEVPEEVEPITKTGDLWELGRHRVLCGDSSYDDNINKLMCGNRVSCIFTDPPYGVAIGDKNKMLNSFQKAGRNLRPIESDNKKPDDLKNILTPIFLKTKEKIASDDCTYFVTAPQGGDLGMMMLMMMMESGLPVRHVLIWLKNSPTFSMGRLDYDYQHEPILLTWTKKHKNPMKGQFKTSVWSIDKPRSNKEHPTMKPVLLYENAYLNNSDKNDLVYDPFLGSGTAVIAAEKTNRICYGIEIDPHYCDVIVKRFHDWCLANDRIPEIKLNGKPYKMV